MEAADGAVSAPSHGLRLPVGFRFRPTDEELVVHYLKKKALRLPFPASVIPVFDVFRVDPINLPGNVYEKRYFFCNKMGEDVDKVGQIRKQKALSSGFWKPIGKDKLVFALNEPGRVVGLRRTMVFCQGNRFADSSKRWIMEEYHLARGSKEAPDAIQLIPSVDENEQWVACAVFRKRRPKIRVKEQRKTDPENE